MATSVLALVLVVSLGLAVVQNESLRNKEDEIAQLREALNESRSELDLLRGQLAERNLRIAKSTNDTAFDLVAIKIGGKEVAKSSGIINEWGLNLSKFWEEVYPDVKLNIRRYSDAAGSRGEIVPLAFEVTLGDRSLEFNGAPYMAANGDLTAEYIAGEFGSARAEYIKKNLCLTDTPSFPSFLDSMGIAFELYDDKSIDLLK